jgi:cell division septum initiation protein DivIVA
MDRFIDNSSRVRGYDAAVVERFLDAATEERQRLLGALEAANARIAAARSHLQAEWELHERIGSVVIQAGRRRRQLEAEAESAVGELLAAADAEADACLAAARAEVARRKLEAAVRPHVEHEAGSTVSAVVESDPPAAQAARPASNLIDLSSGRIMEFG